MDLDLVRQQKDAEREAAGLAPNKPLSQPADSIQSRHAVSQAAAIPEGEAPQAPADLPEEKPIAAAKTPSNPNRRALSPMGSGRRPGEAPAPKKRVRGLLRLFLYAVGGAALGAICGFAAVSYFNLFADQKEFFISCAAGGGALLFGLTHLLNYDL